MATTRKKRSSNSSTSATHQGFTGGLMVAGSLQFSGGVFGDTGVHFYPDGSRLMVKSNVQEQVFFRNKSDWESFKTFVDSCFNHGVQSYSMKASPKTGAKVSSGRSASGTVKKKKSPKTSS